MVMVMSGVLAVSLRGGRRVNWGGVEFRGLGKGTETTMEEVVAAHARERPFLFIFYLLLHEMAHAGQSCARKPTWPKKSGES